MVNKIFILLVALMSSFMASAGQLYVNSKTGNDANSGTQALPLKTLAEAARRVNVSYKKEAATISLAEGVYPLTETVLFNNNKFTAENRLVIKADVMPDDANWNPQRMPLIVSLIPAVLTPGDGESATGLQIEASHVSLEGLKFSGSPTYYYIDGKQSRRYYPVWREGKNLDDLLITQCMFIGNLDLMPIRVAVIANGHGLVLDHCVFYNCENSVVFCDAEDGTSHGNAMRYCLAFECHYSGVWTTGNTGDDFEFHHNIIANGGAAWIRDKSNHRYSAQDCIFTDNKYVARFGSDTGGSNGVSGIDFLKTTNVKLTGTMTIEKDQSKNNYLQLKEGSFGSELKAGLFKK